MTTDHQRLEPVDTIVRRWRRCGLVVGVVFCAISACTEPVPLSQNGLSHPRSIALICKEASGPGTADECSSQSRLSVLVGSGSVGSVAIAAPADKRWLDTDPTVPGPSPLMVGGLPGEMVVHPGKPGMVFVALTAVLPVDGAQPVTAALASIDTTKSPLRDHIVHTALPFAAAGLAITTTTQARLYLADPAGGAIWWLPIEGLDDKTKPQRVGVGGSPLSLLWLEKQGHLYVGHLHHNHVTIVDVPGDLAVGRVSLGPDCDDGIDNDGDGKTDELDRGCDGPFDRDELDPETGATACADGVDNDNDGKTDALDPGCDATATTEPCRDGIDNDGDGETDSDDKDCTDATSGGERRPPCDDGLDNDGDGLVDDLDPDCYHRASPAEVSSDHAPASSLAASGSQDIVFVSHRQRGLLQAIDTTSRALLIPKAGQTTPFERPSKLALRDLRLGVDLGHTPLAMASLKQQGIDSVAVSLAGGGMVVARARDKAGVRSIGLLSDAPDGKSQAQKPTLSIGGKAFDIGSTAPLRHASPGPLLIEKNADKGPYYFGLTMEGDTAEHRNETWRFVYQGQLPGTRRDSGEMVQFGVLRDRHADFCALSVVAGELLLIHRGAAAKDCEGLTGAVVRYRIAEVLSDALILANDGGQVDKPVTLDNQLDKDANNANKVALPDLRCVARSGLRYEIRASQWLVIGSRSGVLSRRGRNGKQCVAFSADDPNFAARLLEPTMASAKVGTPAGELLSCPVDEKDAEALLRVQPYGGGTEQPITSFRNLAFQARLLPGCAPKSSAGDPPRLLPSIRDTTWSYNLFGGFEPIRIPVGPHPVAMAIANALGRAYVVDQGSGTLYVVSTEDLALEQTLE